MKAVVYDKKASPDKLVFRDVEKPEPSDDEVLVKIVVVSPNAADYRSMKMGMIPRKKILGSAISGRVEATGKNIQQFKPGDEILADLADCGFGGFSEYVAVPEDVVAHKPEKITFEEAASLPVAATTALKAIRKKDNLEKGHKVLVVGSSGGVGTFAVQLAKYFGGEVTGVCSTRNVEQTKSIGADHVIDYTKEDFAKSKGGYDLVLAVNGNRSLSAYKRILNPNGVYVMVGGSLSQIFRSLLFGWLMSLGSKKMRTLSGKSNQEELAFVAKLLAEGGITAVIEKRYSLDQTAEAMRYVSEGHARGKVVINVN